MRFRSTLSSIALAEDVFQIILRDQSSRIPFAFLQRIEASLTDHLTVDMVWLTITQENGSTVTVSEDTLGFWQVADQLSSLGFVTNPDWKDEILAKPFEVKKVIVFDRSALVQRLAQ